MRFFQLFCFGILSLSFAQAQPYVDYELPIEDRLVEYCQLNRQERFEEALSFLYPPLFQVMDPIVLVEQLRYNAHHPDLYLNLGARRSTHFGYPIESRGNLYVQVAFTQELHVTFKPDAAEDVDFIEATLAMFSNEFGRENLNYDPAFKQIMINVPRRYLAIRTDAELEWYFLELSPNTLPFLEGLLPPRVRSYLK